jgi:hypothetical protein
MRYGAVSDLNLPELRELARDLQRPDEARQDGVADIIDAERTPQSPTQPPTKARRNL